MKTGVQVAPGMMSQAPDTPNSVEQSPRGSGGKRGAKAGATQRKRKQAKPTPPSHMQPSMHPVQVTFISLLLFNNTTVLEQFYSVKKKHKSS